MSFYCKYLFCSGLKSNIKKEITEVLKTYFNIRLYCFVICLFACLRGMKFVCVFPPQCIHLETYLTKLLI